jgi:hypothetical protein
MPVVTATDHGGRRGRSGVAMTVMAVANLRWRRRRRMAVAVAPVADLGDDGRQLGRVAVTVMAITDLRRGRRGRGRMAVAMVSPADLGRLRRRDITVMAVMDTGLRRAADKGDRRGDQDDRQAVNGTDHAIS